MTEKRIEPGSNPPMGAMPRPAMAGVPADQPNAGMPAPQMPGQGGVELPRFASTSHSAGAPRYEAGTIEVQFRAGLMPRVAAGRPPSLTGGAPFDAVNELLRRYQALGAEPTFAGAAEEGAASYKNDFVTLHFGADANLQEIAAQLNQLSEVERAAPLPSALPPALP